MSWEKVKLSDVCDVRDGTHDSPKYVENGFPLLTSKNIKAGRLDFSEINLISEKDFLEINKRSKVDKGDILMPMIGTIGNPIVVEEAPQFAIKNVCLIKRSTKIHSPYLLYVLKSQLFEQTLLNKSRGGTQKFLSLGDIRNFEIPFPSFTQQQKIAAILEQADALRKKDQQLLAKYDELLESIFYDMFGDPVKNEKGWEKVKLKSLVYGNDKINYGVVQPGEEYEGGIPLVRVGDLKDMMIDKTALKKIAPEIEKNYKRSRLVGDEILIGCVGSIGSIALADETVKGFNIVRATARVRINEDMANRIYIAHHLNSSMIQNYFIKETRTVSQPTLNISHIEETPILLPSKKLQNRFALIAQNVEVQKKQAKEQIQQSEHLFQSLLQKAFKGELIK